MSRELDHEELKALIVEREGEVLAICYLLACERWAEAHVKKAVAEGEVRRLGAKVLALSEQLEGYKRRNPEPATIPGVDVAAIAAARGQA